ncbi:hypothetical protein BsWGS_09929 [Bradybaena similaris]
MPASSQTSAPTFVNVLRIWLSLVAVMAFGNTVMCFTTPSYLFDKLYTVDEKNVSGLSARLFGVWTLLAGGLRLICALDIYNKMLYHATLFSFILACYHFLSEVVFYQTAAWTMGIVAPVIVSSLSIILMAVGYFVICPEDLRTVYQNENEEILKSRPKKQI